MNRLSIVFPSICLLVLMTVSLSGCKTTHYSPVTEIMEKKVGDITFKMRYVPDEELKKRYGKDLNPFREYPGKLPRKQFFFFETTISSEENSMDIKLRDITLTLDSANPSRALSQSTLNINWQTYYRADHEESQMKRKMREAMTGINLRATPSEPFEGNIVFLVSAKDPKVGVIHIPVETDAGDTGTVALEMDLTKMMPAVDRGVKENTGIFAEE